jgi:hypothetical protein
LVAELASEVQVFLALFIGRREKEKLM